MQNAGLGAVLALRHISPEAAIPNALFATWCIVSGSILAKFWSRKHGANRPSPLPLCRHKAIRRPRLQELRGNTIDARHAMFHTHHRWRWCMARIRCRKCGTKFGNTAGKCPRCGTPTGPRQGGWVQGGPHFLARLNLIAPAIAILVLLAAGIAYVWHKVHNEPASITRTASASATADDLSPRTLDALLLLSPDQLDKVDIALINLLCAVGLRGSENLNVQQCIGTLNTWALNIDWETKRNFHRYAERPAEFKNSLAYYRMGMLGTVLAEDLQIQYNPTFEQRQLKTELVAWSLQDWEAFYSDSRDIFLHGLLTGRRFGTCSSMPFLYVALARRLGYPVNLASRKYHLYARYEEHNGRHLNIEATENQGFATPSDEELKNEQFVMTDEEIRDCGWLRPLSNKEVLGICLFNRAHCLRSMKRYDDAVTTLTQAKRYVPDTALMRRVVEKNKVLTRSMQTEDHCHALWTELEHTQLPSAGPKADYFRSKKLQLRQFIDQSTNIVEVECSISNLLSEAKAYRARATDYPNQLAAEFPPRQVLANREPFPAPLGQARRSTPKVTAPKVSQGS